MAAKRRRVTAVSWKKRRIQTRERKTLRMKMRRKCVYLEWTARRRCVQRGCLVESSLSNTCSTDNIPSLVSGIQAALTS